MFRATGRMASVPEFVPQTVGGSVVKLRNGLTIRELTQTVLHNIAEIEESSTESNQNLLKTRCEELRRYIQTHPDYTNNLLSESLQNLAIKEQERSSPTEAHEVPAQCWPPSHQSLLEQLRLKADIERQTFLAAQSYYPQVLSGSSHASRRAADELSVRQDSTSGSESSRYPAPAGINTARYKTEMCRSVTEGNGVCRYGEKCQYAHSIDELRHVPKHPLCKTQLCREFHEKCYCSYGPRCNFIHNEVAYTERYKARMMVKGLDSATLEDICSRKFTPDVPDMRNRRVSGGSTGLAACFGSTSDSSTPGTSSSRSISPETDSVFSPFGPIGGLLGLQNPLSGAAFMNGALAHKNENVFQFAQSHVPF